MLSLIKKEKARLSAKGRCWNFRGYDEKVTRYFSQKFSLPFATARIMSARGITIEEAEDFLYPKLKNLMPSPFILQDMDKAVDVVSKAMMDKQTIGVFGDYDVDGGTSSAIIRLYCDMCHVPVFVHIPDRIIEGYGPNIEAFLRLKEKGAKLIITVDCGSAAPHVMMMAREQGLECVILDHHLTDGITEGAIATVNPNRLDDMSNLGDLTAAGVCFLFCIALTKTLREKNYFTDNQIPEPNLLSLLDLVALGTVCDVAPLTGLNRAFVTQGLKIMQTGQNLGLKELALVGRITEKFSAYHCGFVLGPRINAGGRVGRSSAGYELLTTDCKITAEKLSHELDVYNAERKTIEDFVKEEAILQIEQHKLYNDPVIIASSLKWHVGVVGIVASRIKELYYKPCFILGGDDGLFKGSGRSITGVDIGNSIRKAKNQNLIINGGGHKMAAGLTITGENIPLLRDFFTQDLWDEVALACSDAVTYVDTELTASGVNYALFMATEQLSPFGMGNPSPVFCLRDVKVTFSKQAGTVHLRLRLTDNHGCHISAVCFNCLGTKMGDMLQKHNHALDVIGSLKRDTYRGAEEVQFIIDDVSVAGFF